MTEEPVFEEAWEAQAFAMATLLQQKGLVSAQEWTEALSREIAASPDDSYYEQWLSALERVLADKGLLTVDEMAHRKHEWQEAAEATPHGQPIELKR